jgi:hypothetical protein
MIPLEQVNRILCLPNIKLIRNNLKATLHPFV